MRRLLALALAVAASVLLLAGCSGGGNGPAIDPYQVVFRALNAHQDQVQVSVGFSMTGGGRTTSIDESSMRFVIDNTSGRFLVHISIPIWQLDLPPEALSAIGLRGNTLDLEAIYDGQGLYARSGLLGVALRRLVPDGSLPRGDLTDWIRLATKAELDSMGASSSSPASGPVSTVADAAALRASLESAGVVLSYVETSKVGGVDADHIRGTVDINKMVESPAFDSASRASIEQLRQLSGQMSIKLDLYCAQATGNLVHADFGFGVAGQGGGSMTIGATLASPEPGTAYKAPSRYVTIPLKTLLGSLMGSFGQMLVDL